MPILLTNPFNPGDLDEGKTYPRAQISEIIIDLNEEAPFIRVYYEYGDTVSGVWERGSAAPRKQVVISEEHYQEMVASGLAIEAEGYRVYNAVKRILYGYLIEDVLDGVLEE